MRAYYSEFTGHCIRFYARYPQPRFHTEADKMNWIACDNVLKSFSDNDKALILSLYRESNTMADNVFHLAKRNNVKQESLWKLVEDLERKVAKRRGLL